MSWPAYSQPSGPSTTEVGTACIGIIAPGGSPRNGGAGTARAGKVASVRIEPFAVISNNAFAPAPATTARPGSTTTPNGLLSAPPGTGLWAASNAATSAVCLHSPATLTCSALPNRAAFGPSPLRAAASAPRPITSRPLPVPENEMLCGPVDAKPPAAANEGSPLMTCTGGSMPRRSIRVSAPVSP